MEGVQWFGGGGGGGGGGGVCDYGGGGGRFRQGPWATRDKPDTGLRDVGSPGGDSIIRQLFALRVTRLSRLDA